MASVEKPAPMSVAVVQMTSTTDFQGNMSRACDYVRQAAIAGAKLVALPENFAFLGKEHEKLVHAQKVEDAPFLEPLRKVAQEHSIGILAGTIPEIGPDADHVYNTTVLLGEAGETLGQYRKIHLFDIDIVGQVSFQESAAVAAGEHAVVVPFRGWNIGLTVCYDLRFPALYQSLVTMGAQILMVPAAFTLQTGKDHWEILLRARAIENQCFVVAPDQFGHHSRGRASWGKSLIADPWGTLCAVMPEREGFTMSTLDPEDIIRVRAGLPCSEHRRHFKVETFRDTP